MIGRPLLTGPCIALLIASAAAAQGAPGSTRSSGTDAAPETNHDSPALDEIVVTATKTGETKAQNTPLAVSVFSSDRLNASQVINAKDLVALVPNLNVAQTTTNAQIYIRGIGSNNVFNGSDPDVTVQSDGVYIARAYSQFTDFVDVQRIEVLRGPQGTLYGRNAVGGTINIISRTPTDDFTGKVQLTGGNYNLFQGQAYVSGPIVPGRLQASLTGNYIRHDPYVDNVVPGQHGVNNADRGGLRGQIRFTPSNDVESITRADWNAGTEYYDSFSHLLAPIAFAPIASGLVGDYTKVALDSRQQATTRMWGISEEINFKLGTRLTLKSLTAYRYSHYFASVDNDGTELPIIIATQKDTSRQFSQEFDLTAHLSRLDAVAGLYYFHEHEPSVLTNFIPPSLAVPAARSAYAVVSPDGRTRSEAVFAQGSYHLTDRLDVTAGIRYTVDRKSLDQFYTRTSLNPATPGVSTPNFPFIASLTQKFHAVTPKFGVDYKIAPAVLIYASATRGYKSGGTSYAATNIQSLGFGPETIWAYEGGLKSDWFDRRLRVNLTAFKYDYKDLQVQTLIGSGLVSIGNAATARIKGLEIETTAKPFPFLLLTANYSILDARYGSFPNAAVPKVLVPYVSGYPNFHPSATTPTLDASGNRLNAAPKSSFSGSVQVDHQTSLGKVFLRGEYYWQARAYYDPSNVEIMSQKPYSIINLAVGLTNTASGWSAEIVTRNVTDTHYLISIAANGLVPAGLPAAPRTVAFQLSHSW